MDPLSLILAYALKNPQVTGQALTEANRPGVVDAAQLNSSLIDFARQTLKCYHKTARFVDADVLGSPWQYQYKYGAQSSMVMRISYQGAITASRYQMVVAAMGKEGAFRTAVLQDNAMVAHNANCALEEWVSVQ
jgi:hypothetical protein